MMMMVWVLVLAQVGWVVRTPTYTVGDTVVVERFVPLANPSVRIRVPPLERTDDIEPIRPPAVEYQADGARIRYVVAPFSRSEVEVPLPDFDLVYPDGRVEAMPGGSVRIAPRSVLPETPDDSLPGPRWSRPPIPRQTVRTEPALFFGSLSLACVLIWAVARRRVRPRPAWSSEVTDPAEPPIMDWVSAGEPRAVAALQSSALRRQIARHVPRAGEALSRSECMTVLMEERPDWPLAEIREALAGLDRASFAPAVPSDVLILVDDVRDVMQSIETTETSPPTEPDEPEEPEPPSVEPGDPEPQDRTLL